MDDAPEAGFGSALDRLTLGAGLAAIQERAKSALTEASTAVHNMDDLRRQGLQAAREKAANVEFFNLDGLQEKDPYMVTAGAAAEGGGGGDGGGDDDDGRIFPGHPSPILHAPRDIISRKGKSLTPIITIIILGDFRANPLKTNKF